MMQQLSSSEVTELLAYNYTGTKEFQDALKKEIAPQELRKQLGSRVIKKNA